MRRGSTARMFASVLLLGMLVASCLPGTGPEVRRGPVPLEISEAVLLEPDRINVSVPSCNGDPVVSGLVEDQQQVRIEITTTVTDPGDACLDSLEIDLERPLGQRRLIDMTSGSELPVRAAS